MIHRSIRPVHLMLAASVIVPALLVIAVAWQNRIDVFNQAEKEVRTTTRVVLEHAVRMLEAQELALDRVEEQTSGDSWADIAASPALDGYLKQVADQVEAADTIAMADPAGNLVAASYLRPNGVVSVADRDYFDAALKHVGLYVSRLYPKLDALGPGFVVSRPMRRVDGRGVVVAAVSVNHFAKFYRDIVGSEADVVSWLRDDGVLVLRYPGLGAAQVPPTAGPAFVERIGLSDEGVISALSPVDGVYRLAGYARIPGRQIFVTYSMAYRSIEHVWRLNLLHFLLIAGPATLGLVLVSLAVLQQIDRERRTARQLAEAQEQLRQAQKMESLGQLTGGVAHDFNNLLTVIQGNITLLRRGAEPERQSRMLDAVERSVERATSLTRHLLAFARRQPLEPKPLDLNLLVQDLVELLARSLPPNIRIVTNLARNLPAVIADPNQLEAAILNTSVNARDAMPQGGSLTFTTAMAATSGFVALTIRDTGSGMDAATLARAFEPFFTTKPMGRGTGLGLSMVYGFVQQSGGRIDLTSAPGRGTVLRMELPRTNIPVAPPPVADLLDESGLSGSILVVEDQREVAETTCAMLREAGFTVQAANDPAEAMALIIMMSGIDLVFSDIFMPGPDSGLDLAQKLRGLDPNLPVLLTTGSGQAAIEARAAGFAVLPKPFAFKELLQAIARQRAVHSEIED